MKIILQIFIITYKVKKLCTLLTLPGLGHFTIASTFAGSTKTLFIDTTCLKKVILCSHNSHFLNFAYNCCPQVVCMFSIISRVNKDVINKDNDKMIQIVLKYSIHETHKSGRGISRSKGNDKKLVMLILCLKSYFLNHASLTFSKWYLNRKSILEKTFALCN